MGTVMKGAEVAKEMKETLIREANELKEKGIDPCLAIIRVGARSADLSYERGAKKRMELAGIACKVVELSEDITQEEFEEEFQKVNQDPEVHGILLFRPLPKHLNEEKIKNIIHPFKDVDCMSPVNLAKVFSGDDSGFAPCTPEAVIKMLEHYGISLCGKKVTVVGRSMVVGRPLSMLLLKRHATITICHTRTKDLEKVCREADILIAAAGKPRMITGDMAKENAVIVDVGINVDEEGRMCGDVDFESLAEKAAFITPVPGGVGGVTTSILAAHVLRGVKYLNGISKE